MKIENAAGKGRLQSLQLLFLMLNWSLFPQSAQCAEVWHPPATGLATITHYYLPAEYIASCGCTAKSTHYPTAALSALAFGSTQNFGPSCGACYRLTPLNTFLSTPPWYPTQEDLPSIVVKITDLCPTWSTWCDATTSQPNQAGHYLNFDLATPSLAIPEGFFPSNESYYGYSDFGVWNASYVAVSCTEWSGWGDAAALGSVSDRGDSVCCPADTANVTCPSFSEQHGDPVPPTGSSNAERTPASLTLTMSVVIASILFSVIIP